MRGKARRARAAELTRRCWRESDSAWQHITNCSRSRCRFRSKKGVGKGAIYRQFFAVLASSFPTSLRNRGPQSLSSFRSRLLAAPPAMIFTGSSPMFGRGPSRDSLSRLPVKRDRSARRRREESLAISEREPKVSRFNVAAPRLLPRADARVVTRRAAWEMRPSMRRPTHSARPQ